MPTTLQSHIAAVAGTASGDLQPLLANSTFTTRVNAELALRDDAAEKSAAVNALSDDLASAVQPFASACTALRAIVKRFPETSIPIAEAIKQTQTAMGVLVYNVPPASTPAPVPTKVTTMPATAAHSSALPAWATAKAKR
jgi:hypothetical protein